jgi:hypothetical protein
MTITQHSAASQMAQTAQPPQPAPLTLDTAGALRTTRYSDVCGGTDEFKRLLLEEPEVAASPAGRDTLRRLLDDGLYMLARMEVRLREYQAFRDELARLMTAMRAIEEPRLADAAAEAERIRQHLTQVPQADQVALPADELIDRAEEIRQVANDMEGALRRHKEAAIAAGRAYLARPRLGGRQRYVLRRSIADPRCARSLGRRERRDSE